MLDTVFCVAPGPSLAGVDVDLLRAGCVVAVKRAIYKVPFAAAVVSAHVAGFYDTPEMAAFAAVNPACRRIYLRTELEPRALPGLEVWERGPLYGLSRMPGTLSLGLNSGHAGLNFAFHELRAIGARRIVLVGFDMRLVDGRSHYDLATAAPGQQEWFYSRYFVKAFTYIAADLRKAGVEVLNATPDSGL